MRRFARRCRKSPPPSGRFAIGSPPATTSTCSSPFTTRRSTRLAWLPATIPTCAALYKLMQGFGFSGPAEPVRASARNGIVDGALHYEFGFPAGLIELGTIDLPSYGHYVTAADREKFGADLIAAIGTVFQ